VIFTNSIDGSINADSASALIGHATSAYQEGDHRLFVVNNGTQGAVFYFSSADANSDVGANELTLLALLPQTANVQLQDFLFIA
jgi:hypothetical protein